MRTRTTLLCSTLALGLSASASDTPIAGTDTLREQAVAFLEKNLNDLRDIRTRSQAFTSAFLDESARHPCDICRDRSSDVDLHKYAFEAEQAYPERFEFTNEILRDGITVLKLDKSEYRYRIPYIKHIPASPLAKNGGNRPDLRKPYTVRLTAVVKYLNGRFGIENVEGEPPPPSNTLMVELAPMLAMGSPAFDGQKGFAPDVSGNLIKAGIVWYFGSSSMKKSGVWLKTGLRAAMRTAKLESSDLEYVRKEVVLTPATGENEIVIDPSPTIDVRTGVSHLNETVRTTAIEIPLGLSKRMPMGKNMDLSLEAEVGYSVVVANTIDGDYELERTGTNHVIADETMQASGGLPLTYDHPDAAVKEATTGEVIDFFTGHTSLLDGLKLDKSAYLSFGFLPSVFIRKGGQVKYNIGLRFQMVGNPRTNGYVLDGDHFMNADDNDRPTLSTLTNSSYQTFIGLTLGLTL